MRRTVLDLWYAKFLGAPLLEAPLEELRRRHPEITENIFAYRKILKLKPPRQKEQSASPPPEEVDDNCEIASRERRRGPSPKFSAKKRRRVDAATSSADAPALRPSPGNFEDLSHVRELSNGPSLSSVLDHWSRDSSQKGPIGASESILSVTSNVLQAQQVTAGAVAERSGPSEASSKAESSLEATSELLSKRSGQRSAHTRSRSKSQASQSSPSNIARSCVSATPSSGQETQSVSAYEVMESGGSDASFLTHDCLKNYFSDYRSLRRAVATSWNPFVRIGLERNFFERVCEMIRKKFKVHCFALRDIRQQQALKPEIVEASDFYWEIIIEYVPRNPFGYAAIGNVKKQSIKICCRPTCHLMRLSIPLFGLPDYFNNMPEKWPSMQSFTQRGEELPAFIAPGPTVQQAINLGIRFFTLGGHLFKIGLESERIEIPESHQADVNYWLRISSQIQNCEICRIQSAELEVLESIMLPTSPCYLCSPCFQELFPDPDNQTDYSYTLLMPETEPLVG